MDTPELLRNGRLKLSKLRKDGYDCDFRHDADMKHRCDICIIPEVSRDMYCQTHTKWIGITGRAWDEIEIANKNDFPFSKGVHFDVIHSKKIDDDIVILNRENVGVPDEYWNLVVYSKKECDYLVENKFDDDHLKNIHLLKKQFGGTIEGI